MMSVIGWIVFGLIVGVVGKILMPGKDPGGFLATVAIGIIGALFGGMLGRMIGMYGQDDPVGFVMAVIGAILFLWLYRVITRRGDT
ncbi:GlsB/YeaQ/YmgE family stress response membrane protein [uncultured Nitrospira sp.]|uniref:GlsB/YeaQ/YmgE family stress response membrane protein n=1 Tax=uncultured Nitrospira sp. TaxID=157176 RepID=UPI0031409004